METEINEGKVRQKQSFILVIASTNAAEYTKLINMK